MDGRLHHDLDFPHPRGVRFMRGYELSTFPPQSNKVWISNGKSRVLIGTNTGYVEQIENPPVFRVGAFWERMQNVVDYFNGKAKPQAVSKFRRFMQNLSISLDVTRNAQARGGVKL